jgi:hypothetical protein
MALPDPHATFMLSRRTAAVTVGADGRMPLGLGETSVTGTSGVIFRKLATLSYWATPGLLRRAYEALRVRSSDGNIQRYRTFRGVVRLLGRVA